MGIYFKSSPGDSNVQPTLGAMALMDSFTKGSFEYGLWREVKLKWRGFG
jgi:hypothetical protein